VDELSAAGHPISTPEFNAIIYCIIGAEYHAVITALNLRPEPISFYELHGQLIAREILLKSIHEPFANLSQKFLTTASDSSPSASTFSWQ
jgi:hypothetical protein